jgi:pimeloyl-ACP methyl ester carboxylesterase
MIRTLALASIVLAIVLLGAGCVVLTQRDQVFLPRPYEDKDLEKLPARTVRLEYESGGRQVAFWLPPLSARRPERVWMFFVGKGGHAPDWVEFSDALGLEDDGFLLFEQPGAGLNEGRPSPRRIEESAAAAFNRLAVELEMEPKELARRTWAVGYSLGAAKALLFARQHEVERLVLLAPFTSLKDMARRVVSWPLYHLLVYELDNKKRLDELAKRESPPPVVIFHGTNDELIPDSMGMALASRHPSMVTYISLEGVPHGTLIGRDKAPIVEKLRTLREGAAE